MTGRNPWPLLCNLIVAVCVAVFSSSLRARTVLPEEFNFHHLTEGFASFPSVRENWGMENLSFAPMDDGSGQYMRVFIPKGAIDPGTMARRGLRRGGAGFKSQVFPQGADHALLSYQVRFPAGFDFVWGGKLPGMYGGVGNSGGSIPNGTDGFSFRLMWGTGGTVSVYAYLPSSIKYGTALFQHRFSFMPGRWYRIVQEVKLNDAGVANGILRLWVDDRLIGEQQDLMIRTTNNLRLNGIFFDVFFGGNDDRWAAKHDTHIDFANFAIKEIQPGISR